jgi:hypothetical protein
MILNRLLSLASAIFCLYSGGRLVSTGYARRRGLWTRASWIRLLGVSAAALTLTFLPALAEVGIYLGYYSRNGMSAGPRTIWMLLSLASMFGGVIILIGALVYFAHGEPTAEPFGLASWQRGWSFTMRRSA